MTTPGTEPEPASTRRREQLTPDDYRQLIERLPVVVYAEAVEDDVGQLLYVSPQAERILGISAEEWMADREIWVRAIHPDDRERVLEANRLANQTQAPFACEYRIVTPDGKVRWFSDEAALVRGAQGEPRYWHGLMLDITERKGTEALEQALAVERETARQLRAVDELKSTFLQAVSHDLRTPLAAILGLSITLKRRDVEMSEEEIYELAGRITTNARKLDRLVRDLLDLDRLDRGIVEPKLVKTDVAELVRRMVEDSKAWLGERTVLVETEPTEVSVDAAKVERIVENLLANAVRHTPASTAVCVRVRPDQGGALIAVEDEGLGVPEEHRAGIFEPFRQGPEVPEYSPGVGVGLALVARFAELMGGRVWVEERDGGGASFRVWLANGRPLILDP